MPFYPNAELVRLFDVFLVLVGNFNMNYITDVFLYKYELFGCGPKDSGTPEYQQCLGSGQSLGQDRTTKA